MVAVAACTRCTRRREVLHTYDVGLLMTSYADQLSFSPVSSSCGSHFVCSCVPEVRLAVGKVDSDEHAPLPPLSILAESAVMHNR